MNKKQQPPKLADRFFQWYCNPRLAETILGDLHEDYIEKLNQKGVFRARLIYWLNVFRFINRHTLSRKPHELTSISNTFYMIKTYLLITFRNLKKNKTFASINILGLGLAMASCMIIATFVAQELSTDRFHTKSERIFKVTNTFVRSSGKIAWARTPPALAPAISEKLSGIEKVTRMRYADQHQYTYQDKTFLEDGVFYADSSFLEIFDFQLIEGDRQTALSAPNSMVITQDMAKKYFGEENPIGKVIQFDRDISLIVTGVLQNLPKNSHLTFDMLISFQTYQVPEGYLADLNSWSWAGYHTYVLLHPGANPETINQQITDLYNSNSSRVNLDFYTELQPLAEIYLGSGKYTNVGEGIRSGNPTTIYGLTIVAVLILLMAGFNFMNLSTAQSLSRGKEIGLRKFMGSNRRGVIHQFLVESCAISLISLVIAMLLVQVAIPLLKGYLNVDIITAVEFFGYLPYFILGTIFTGLLAGIYPATLLSSFKPLEALAGQLKTGKKGAFFRLSLMTVQFVISLSLIAGSLIIVQQIRYINNKELGFDQDQMLSIRLSSELQDQYEVLKNEFLQHPDVLSVAVSSHNFDGGSSSGPANIVGKTESESTQLAYYQTDENFLEVSGIELQEGRFFQKGFMSDSNAMVLNETAVRLMDLNPAIGSKINFSRAERTVIGVISDFHFNSLHTEVAPLAIIKPFTRPDNLLIKINSDDLLATIVRLEKSWQKLVGDDPFEVTFIDDQIARMYSQEKLLARLMTIATVLAIAIAIMGLYGIFSFTIRAKLKEIGIRKVLGASMSELLFVISKKLLIMTLIANILAWPIIYIVGNEWLNSFTYRIDLPFWILLGSGLLLILIGTGAIGHQTIKAANTNPADVLRDE